MTTLKSLALAAVLSVGLATSALADNVRIIGWSIGGATPNGDGTYTVNANVTFEANITSRPSAVLSFYVERYSPATGGCAGGHRTAGLVNNITVSQGYTPPRSVGLSFRVPGARRYVAPGVNLWPYAGATIHTPGAIQFGESRHLCRGVF